MQLEDYIKDKNILYRSKKSFKLFLKDYIYIVFMSLVNPVLIPWLIANCVYGIQYFFVVIIPFLLLFFVFDLIIMPLITNYTVFTGEEIIFYNIFKKIRKIIKYSEVSTYCAGLLSSAVSINKNIINGEKDLSQILSIICQKCVFNSAQKSYIEYLNDYKGLKKFFKWWIIITIIVSSGFAICCHNKLLSFYYAVKGDYLYNKYMHEKPVNKLLMNKSYDYLLKSVSYNLSQDEIIWKCAIKTAHYLEDFEQRDKLSQMAVNIYPDDLFFKEVTRDKKRFDDLIIPLDKRPLSMFKKKSNL